MRTRPARARTPRRPAPAGWPRHRLPNGAVAQHPPTVPLRVLGGHDHRAHRRPGRPRLDGTCDFSVPRAIDLRGRQPFPHLGQALGDPVREQDRHQKRRSRVSGGDAAVEAKRRIGVADPLNRLANDVGAVHVRLGADLSGHARHAGGDQRLAGDSASRIVGADRVEHGVGDLVRDLVGMTLGDRFGGEDVPFGECHGA